MSSSITGSVLAAVASLIGNIMAYLAKRLSLNNATDMKANAAAATQQRLKDEAVQVVRRGKLDEIRKGVAE